MMKDCFSLLVGLSLLVVTFVAHGETPAPSLPDELADSYVRVVRTGGFSPFRRIEYSVIARSTAPVANYRKSLVNYPEELSSLSLVSISDYEDYLKKIEKAGAFSLTDAVAETPDSTLPIYRVELKVGERSAQFSFQPRLAADGYQKILRLTKRFVMRHTNRLPFRNVFFDAGSFGYVDVESVPTARVYLDGRDTGLETPLESYEVPAGSHTMRLVSESEKVDREYEFRVESGMTTLMKLDLR